MAKVNTRIQSKHDVEKNWANATFAPLPGEIIIYDKDKGVDGGKHEMPRIKVGDGVTPVGSLPFVVDMEETNRAIDLVDADVQTAIKNVTANGTSLTFTKVDGSTVSVNTQDTNTDTMVTNTKANTTKAYITGTTSASTKTSTQVFDSTVYLDTEEGKLVAKKFQGKAMQDDLGNTISTTYETQADATEKLATAKSYTDTKTTNMNKEAYLSWGGKNIDAAVGPVGAALSSEHSANRLAYLNPAALSFETSNNSGSTWSSMSVSNADKIKLVTTACNALKVGTANPVTAGNRTRMTLSAATSSTTYVYTRPRKLLLNVCSPHGIKVLVEYKSGASGASWSTLTDCTISGWSAWNEIDLSALSTLGGSPTQTGNIWYLRLTFYVKDTASINSNYNTTLPYISSIRLFGDTCWSRTSNLGETGHLYSYDESQNATFPAKVTATQFVGPLQGNAATATSATSATKATNDGSGNNIVNTYATKTALQNEAEPSLTISDSFGANGTVTETAANIASDAHNVVLTVDTTASDKQLWEIRKNVLGTGFSPTDMLRPLYTFSGDYMSSGFTYTWLGNGSADSDAGDIMNNLYCYPYPEFNSTSGSFVLQTADIHGNCTYFLDGVFYSPSQNRVYLRELGCFYGQDTSYHASYYIDADLNKLYINNSTTKHVYTVPKDLVLITVGYCTENNFVYESDSAIQHFSANLYGMTCDASFLDDLVYIDEAGTYLLPYGGGETSTTLELSGPIAANYTISYLRNSGVSKTIKHIRECNSKNFEEELSKVISSGRSDPDSDTPGLFYFKYL